MSVVELRGLAKAYGSEGARVDALAGVDLAIGEGEFVAVMGPSGSGKSTLLHLAGGLDTPSAGEVRIGGESLGALSDDGRTLLRRRRIGFVFQFFNLLPMLSAEENVALPLVLDGVPGDRALGRARAAMETVGIAQRAGHRPSELSGGEQQRVAIARALAIEPVLLLADEPTGNLDRARGEQVVALLRRLVDERRQTILMVTHDARSASMADRLVQLRDGRIVDDRPLEERGSVHEVLRRLERLEQAAP